jgi:hypothetical protein
MIDYFVRLARRIDTVHLTWLYLIMGDLIIYVDSEYDQYFIETGIIVRIRNSKNRPVT